MIDRSLPSELQAEGWVSTSEHGLLWCHEPSRQCVTVSPFQSRGTLIPDLGGFEVGLDLRNSGGFPIDGSWVWVRSHQQAVRRARGIRSLVLAGVRAASATKTLSFGDVIEMAGRDRSGECP